jgi:Leucine-rich repeat (LRR) protein
LDTNRLTGPLPSAIGDLSSLEYFAADWNNFTGHLPTALGRLTNLRRFDFERNSFSGSLPSELYAMASLQALDLFQNELTGTISSLIGQLTALRSLSLGSNRMNGSIPTEVDQLTHLTLLRLSKNSFTSSLPSSLWTFTNISVLDVSSNSFEGSLPEDLSALSSLAILALHRNAFIGTIPSSFGCLTSMVNLDLATNQFEGSLPSELGRLRRVTTIEISNNHFTGSLPSSIGDMWALTWLEVQDNFFDGTIPPEIGSLKNLRYLIFPNCLFAGPLPCAAFPNLTSLTYLDTSLNFLSGSLCSELGALSSLENFFSASNHHTSHLPDTLGLVSSLQTIELPRNHLTGRLPSSFGDLTECVVLSLSHNLLTGPLPSQLGSLKQLEQLYLQNNRLRGQLSRLLWQAQELHLINLDLSANRFSGSVSSALFLIPSIQTIAMTSNCFTGTLPPQICSAGYLSVLSLDGLGVAKECSHELSTVVYPQWRTTWGDIPQCLWTSMPNLTVLSLSGNGLTGSLSSLPDRSRLVNLTLSHNHLTGTIPRSLQTYPFVSLDLSYNKLTGEAASFVLPTQRSFRRILEVNRLSGSLLSISSDHARRSEGEGYTISFLAGNIFGCNHLPRDDEAYSSYLCGSEEFDDSLTVLGSVLATIVLALALMLAFKSACARSLCVLQRHPIVTLALEAFQSLYKYHTYFDSNEHLLDDGVFSRTAKSRLSQVQAFVHSFRHMKTTVILVMAIGALATIPIFFLKALDSGQHRTHSHLYRWMWTAAYIKGVVPAGLLLLAWLLSAGVLIARVDSMVHQQSRDPLLLPAAGTRNSSSLDELEGLSRAERSRHMLSVALMVLANIAIVGAVNGLFIFSTLQDLNQASHFWIEITVSVFKIVWNSALLPFVTRRFQRGRHSSPSLLAKLSIFNTIFIPCLAAAFTSPSCFQVQLSLLPYLPPRSYSAPLQGVIVPPKEITSTYSYTTCYAYAGVRRLISGEYVSWCAAYTEVAVEVAPFRPHFYYNNLCASTILQAYLPIYTYSYALLLLFPPISLYLLSRYVTYESLPLWLKPFVPAIIWPLESEEAIRDSVCSRESVEGCSSSVVLDPVEVSPMLFKRDNIAVSLMLHVALLLTFGLCSPILGFAIMTVTCLSMTIWRILIARFVSLRAQQAKALFSLPSVSSGYKEDSPPTAPRRGSRPMKEDDVINVLSAVVGDTAACFQSMLRSVLWTSCLFFAFLCWDVAADTVGWVQSCWIPLVAFCLLPLMRTGLSLGERLWWAQNNFPSELSTNPETGNSALRSGHSNEPEGALGRPSEFGEWNPLRVTSLEMVQTSLSVTHPSHALAAAVRGTLGAEEGEEEEGSVRHTV